MIRFTLISNELRDPQTDTPLPLSKTFSLGPDNSLQKKTAAQLMQGRAEHHEVRDIAEFEVLLSLILGPHEALAYGVTEQTEARVVTQKELRNNPDAIARNRKHFSYPSGPAIWFLDYDPPPGCGEPLSGEQVRAHLIEACPELAGAPMVATASTSAFIYNGDQELHGARGSHLYVAVADGTDIERVGKALYERLWLVGHGRYEISGAGTLLDRNMIDASVWQPERLDFAFAHCIEPLTQRRPAPLIWNAGAPPFDTRLITESTAEQRAVIAQKRAEARAAVETKRHEVRDAWVVKRGQALQARGVDPATAQRTAEDAAENGVLLGDFELQTEDGRIVTVGHVLANRKDFHSTRFADPLEPEYRGDSRIAYANLFGGGRPFIYSHAHGGRRYFLYPQSRTLKLERGELPRLADAVRVIMRAAGDVYDQPLGEGRYRLVHVHERHIIGASDTWLRSYIGRLVRCERFDKRTNKCEAADVPRELVETVLAEPKHGLPVLEAIIKDPTMRADGSILDQPGYSEPDRLLFESDDLEQASIPESPTVEQIRAAFGVLWKAFERFPFVDEHARAAMLAALLTAVVRPMLDTSPAFLFEAPASGSGKSLLQKCVYTLATGQTAVADTPPATDEEAKKSLHAALRSGARCIAWDNLVHPVSGSSALCAFVTAANYSGRVLGVSQMEALPNKALLLMSGNNPRVEGDACRRVVRVRIDAEVEQPALRTFDLAPESYVSAYRRELWTAALTILRAFQSRGAPKQIGDTAGGFETWDRVVRQCVIWLGRTGLVGVALGDPYHSAIENVAADPQAETVLNVLRAWRAAFGGDYKSAGEALSALMITREGIEALTAIDTKGFSAVRFGGWLKKHEKHIVGGLRIVLSRNTDSGNWKYAVLLAPETETQAAIADLL